MGTLDKSLKPVASFRVKNNTETSVKLCLLPGHYDTKEILVSAEGKVFIGHCNPSALVDAGFQCQQVADDYKSATLMYDQTRGAEAYPLVITPKSKRTRYRDFLHFIRLKGLRVTKIKISDNLDSPEHKIFQSEMEVSASSIGSKVGSDFIQLSDHRKPSNYDQSFIEVDFSSVSLEMTETTLLSLEVPGGADFYIDFTVEPAD